jgi:hypothetical protein
LIAVALMVVGVVFNFALGGLAMLGGR